MSITSSIGASKPGVQFNVPDVVEVPQPVVSTVDTQQISKEQDERKRRSDLESLIFTGRIEREVDVMGKKFKMHTLTNEEQKFTFKYLSSKSVESSITDTLELRDVTLALAIDSIEGMPIESIYSGTETDTVTARMDIIGKWQPFLIQKVFEKYNDLVEASKAAIFGDEVNSEDNDTLSKEARENVKK